MKGLLLSINFLLVLSLQAQDISGIWRGHFVQGGGRMAEIFGYEEKYKFEVQIIQNNKQLSGVTYSYLTTVFYGKANLVGSFNPSTKKVLLEENKLLEVKSQSGGGACLMTCFLQYNKVNGVEYLEGNYSSVSARDTSRCGSGRVYLRKVENSDFYKEPFIVELEKARERRQNPPVVRNNPPATRPAPPVQANPEDTPAAKAETPERVKDAGPPVAHKIIPVPKDTVASPPPPPAPAVPKPKDLVTRANEVVQTINAEAGDITISIYDNGTIDNDTVSVYVNNKLVISRERLTDQPITFTVSLDKTNAVQEVVLVAENLGDIPPNTSLMVVKAGGQTHEVRITSTETKNAVVLLKLQE